MGRFFGTFSYSSNDADDDYDGMVEDDVVPDLNVYEKKEKKGLFRKMRV
jgi:hypothetical protein